MVVLREVEWDKSSHFGGTILELCSMCSSRGGIRVIECGVRESMSTQALLTASSAREWGQWSSYTAGFTKHKAAPRL